MIRIFTVSEINRYAHNLVEKDAILQQLFIKGEISNLRSHSSGHLYFSLKDKTSSLSCVMWKGNKVHLLFDPQNGDEIIVYGYFSLFEKNASFQFFAETMEPAGAGHAFLKFELLKKQLFEEGLFDLEHKKNIPIWIQKVAIVTSETASVYQDILKIIKRRNPFIKTQLYPVLVQGEMALSTLLSQLQNAENSDADCIIIARGGGSFEDLAVFNEEKLARAVFACKKPVISAIGHETDTTLLDFTSDLRAETPSAAAEIISYPLDSIMGELKIFQKQIHQLIKQKLEQQTTKLSTISKRKVFITFQDKLLDKQEFLHKAHEHLIKTYRSMMQSKELTLIMLNGRLIQSSPTAILEKGFALVTDKEGKKILSRDSVNNNDDLIIHFRDGKLTGKITNVVKE